MESAKDYGNELPQQIALLLDSLSEEERRNYYRLGCFVKLWEGSTGGSADINEHTDFFLNVNLYALRQIDAVFFEKFNKHITKHPEVLGMDENSEEWKNGIKPCAHYPKKIKNQV